MLKEYPTLDATALAAFTAGELRIDKDVDTAIAHIDRPTPLLNAVVTPLFTQARTGLAATPGGPFHGVPFLTKDLSYALGIYPDNLRIGMQRVGRRIADAMLLNLTAKLEVAQPWVDRRPGSFAVS